MELVKLIMIWKEKPDMDWTPIPPARIAAAVRLRCAASAVAGYLRVACAVLRLEPPGRIAVGRPSPPLYRVFLLSQRPRL